MEELLRRSEEKFRGLVENLHDAVMTFDPSTHKFTSANPAGIAMFGAKNEEELISFGPGSLSPERQLDGSLSVEKVWKWMEAVDKGPQRFEWIHGRISGGTFFSEVMLTQMEHRGRRVFLSTIRDITERKRASDLLLDSQQRLQLATESAHIGIWDWDVVQDRLVWDAKMYALYGIPERESGGTFEIWQQCLHPLDRKRAEAEIAAALGGIKDFNTEFRVLWPTGEVRYIEAHGIVKRAADGSATRMIGVNRDITERKHAEEALHESEARFAGAFQCAPIGVGLVSLVGRFIKVNRALCDVFGYSEAELLNRNFQKITHPADLAADLENVRRLVAGETPSYQMEKRYIHAKGHFVTALLSVSLVRDGHGQPLHFISQIQDITERKLAVQQLTELKLNEERSRLALEQEKKSSQIKSRFVSLVSHEFRTPLSVINMATELLDGYFDKLTEAERSEHLDEIRSSVERMTQMMNDFLIHGNCASGKMECKPAWVEVKALCSRLISEVPHYAGSSSPIECFVDPALGKSCLDEKILAHILGNLLSNAVKYSLAGQPVKLEARRIADSPPPNGGTDTFSEPHVEFKVSDSGIGIPAADFAKLYQTFHRAGNVGNRPGAGMGLAIVKQFVDLLGGKIRFESNEGKGTTVWVQLPIALPKSQPER